ncbi:unnamed protein product [Rotaria sp. Silwood2]|nr:unnamed protein product [Rotaria sp. Silwood2]CAF4049878.1 unnamed protein product [Rotaria sp. Silwood2]
MSSNKRESNGTKPKIDTSKPHKSRRALSAAPTAAKSTSSAGESKATTTKKITSEATNLASSVAATSVSKPNASMITPSVTNVLAGDSSTSNTITATTKPSTFTVSLYALRYFIDSDNVKLQAVFGSKLVQDFKEIARLSKDKKRDYIPSVFQLSANIQIDVDDIPYILMGKVRHRCTDYYLHVEKSTLFFQNPKCDEIARRSINSKISSIQFLFDLRFPPGTDKAILDKLTCDYIKLSSSFHAVLICSKYILQHYLHDETVKTRVKQAFNEVITQRIFDVRLNEIVMLLKLLQDPLPTDENEKELTEVIHSMIETSVTLQNKINIYLSKLIIQDNDLKLLYELFQCYNPILLFNFDKQTYLHKVFNQNEQRSCEFYIHWFEYFLCDIHYVESEQEWSYFQLLMNKWSDKIVDDRILFRQIVIKMDSLLDRLSDVTNNKPNSRRFIYFVKHMIDKCFKRNSISDAIINVGSNIKNKIFIQEFERKFKEEYFLPYEYQIKTMQTINNPLIILIELYQRKEASHLVTRLLEICCDAINITHDELLQHTLERPSNNTLTYIILCENCFIKIPIRLNILDQLTKFWNIWEQKGLQARQIRCWQIFTFNQRYYFNEIWNIVEKFAKKKYSVNRLFDTQYQEMLRIIKLKENIVNCLNAYCSEDSDKTNYLKLLQSMQLQIDDGAVHGIVVEPELKKLEPLAIRLSHVSKSNAWMHYYTKQLENKSSLLTINVDLPS